MTRKTSIKPYVFLGFPLSILAVFTLLPTVAGLCLGCFEWDGGSGISFVGVRHFKDLLHDPQFGPALRNTLLFVGLSVPPAVMLGFLLAAVLSTEWFVGRAAIRAAIFMPTVVSIVAIGFIWRWVLDPQSGLLMLVLKSLGIDRAGTWASGPYWIPAWIVAVSVWRSVGFCMVLYLAAIAGIGQSLYEAAAIDGASRLRTLIEITWKQVRPTTAFLLVTGIIGALQVFDIVFVMTGQQETARTNVLNLYLYRQFTRGNFGYAAAIGTVLFGLSLATMAGPRLLTLVRKGTSPT